MWPEFTRQFDKGNGPAVDVKGGTVIKHRLSAVRLLYDELVYELNAAPDNKKPDIL